jgi:glucose-1-phosphate thymidylyltransferase
MAGGSGTRLHPLTIAVNKHLLPVYNKPLIYYSISTLMLVGIREILIICDPEQKDDFYNLLGDGSQFGVTFTYKIQDKPEGIAQGILIAEDFIRNEKVALILGDNIFNGVGLGRQLSEYSKIQGGQGFAYNVRDPHRYGVVELDKYGNVLTIEEKPINPKGSLALTGLYFYDENVFKIASELLPSSRGELEITDLNRAYLEQGRFKVKLLPRGTAWLDTGTFESLHDASSYIKIIEERQDSAVGDPKEVAINQGWIES